MNKPMNVTMESLMPIIEEQLLRGQSVRFAPQGISMLPMIRQNIDSVVISPVSDKLKKYDLPLYRRPNGKFILHRIVEVGDTYTCMGDNQFVKEHGVKHDQMIAVVTAFYRACFLQGSIIVGILVCLAVCRHLRDWLSSDLDRERKKDLLHILLQGEYKEVSSYHSGELLNRLNNDVRVLNEGILSIVPSMAALLTKLISAMAVLVALEPRFAVGILAAGVLVIVMTALMRKSLKALHKKVSSHDGVVSGFLQEIMEKLLMVQAMDVSEEVEKRADKLMEDRFEVQRKRKNVSLFANTSVSVMYYGVGFVTLVWCAGKMLKGEMSFGSLTAMTQLVNQLQAPFTGMSGVIPQYIALIAAAERLMELENITTTVPEMLDSPALHLELHMHMNSFYNQKYYDDVWERVKVIEGHRYGFNTEDTFIHVFNHFARHYRCGGIGCRHLIDIYVLRRAYPKMDEAYILEEMKKIHLQKFYKNACDLLEVWFGDAAFNESTLAIHEYIFNSGSWGTMASHATAGQVEIANESGEVSNFRTKAILKTVLPNFESMKGRYPILEKAPFLLPVTWLLRWGKAIRIGKDHVPGLVKEWKAIEDENVLFYQEQFRLAGLDIENEK